MLKRDFRFSEARTLQYLKDMTKAIAYIHDRLIIHRDIKLANFVISSHERETVKLCDFGLCCPLSHYLQRRNSFVGTPNYIAPDVLRANIRDFRNFFYHEENNEEEGYSFGIDMWSLGVCVYLMMVGRCPFEGETVTETYQRIVQNKWIFPKFMESNDTTRNIISHLLCPDEKKRWNVQDLQHHLEKQSLTPSLNIPSAYDVESTSSTTSGKSITSLSMFGCLDRSLAGKK